MISLTIIACALLLLVFVVLFYVIPWMGKVLSIALLHDLRDEVFAAGMRFPAARRTLLYRDVEAMLSTGIHVLRDCEFGDAVRFFSSMHPGKRKVPPRSWRHEQYMKELDTVYASAAGQAALADVLRAFSRFDGAVGIGIATGHPLTQAVSLVAAVVALVAYLARRIAGGSRAAPDKVAEAMQGFASPREISGAGRLEAVLSLTRTARTA